MNQIEGCLISQLNLLPLSVHRYPMTNMRTINTKESNGVICNIYEIRFNDLIVSIIPRGMMLYSCIDYILKTKIDETAVANG